MSAAISVQRLLRHPNTCIGLPRKDELRSFSECPASKMNKDIFQSAFPQMHFIADDMMLVQDSANLRNIGQNINIADAQGVI